MVIAADESWSVASSCSFRTTPDSVDKTFEYPLKNYWCGSWSSVTAYAKRIAIVRQNCALAGIRQLQIMVVDEPGGPDPDGQHSQAAWRRKGGWVDYFGIVQLGQGLGADRLDQDRSQPAGIAFPPAVSLGRQSKSPAQASRGSPLVWAQVRVPRAQGQPVRLSDGRTDSYLHTDVQVRSQAHQHRHLLCVLLAEVRPVGGRDGEELRDHGRHAFEMTRSRRSFQPLGDPMDDHARARAGRVHVRHRGLVDRVHARGAEHGQVALGAPGVFAQVLAGAELDRVDEYAGHHPVVFLASLLDQAHMPRMQCAHRRDQPDRSTVRVPSAGDIRINPGVATAIGGGLVSSFGGPKSIRGLDGRSQGEGGAARSASIDA